MADVRLPSPEVENNIEVADVILPVPALESNIDVTGVRQPSPASIGKQYRIG